MLKKNKKLVWLIVLCIVVAIASGLFIHSKLNSGEVEEESATEISYHFFQTMMPIFNTGDFNQIRELYLPCQEEENFGKCYNQMYHEVFKYIPFTLDGVLEIEEAKGNTIRGQVIYGDIDGSYNVLDEFDNGWTGFGNKKVANFELIKKDGKMYLNSFEIVANYNWRTIQEDPEFFDKYMNKLYRERIDPPEPIY